MWVGTFLTVPRRLWSRSWRDERGGGMASGRKAKLAEVAGNDRFQIECNEFLQHHSPDSCTGDVEMIAPVAHENCVGTRSGVANWRFDNLVIWRLALSGQIGCPFVEADSVLQLKWCIPGGHTFYSERLHIAICCGSTQIASSALCTFKSWSPMSDGLYHTGLI